MAKQQEDLDWYARTRGSRESTPLGTSFFVILRLLDGFVIQRALQTFNPLALITSGFELEKPVSQVDQLKLIILDYDIVTFQDAIWAMSIAAALKQCIYLLFVSREPMFVDYALFICFFNTTVNGINTLLFSITGSNPTWFPMCMYIGTGFFIVGLSIELISEIQRKSFKDQKGSEGKIFTGQLFGFARSVNYFGYLVWRTAFALAAGGVGWGVICFVWFTWYFITTAIPGMEEYLSRKYGKQWDVAKRKVPYCLIPYVY